MSRPSNYNNVRWTREEMIHELEVILASIMFSYNGSTSRELRETYDRQASILTAVLGSIKSDMSNVWEVRAKAHQQASDAKDTTITQLRAALAPTPQAQEKRT